MWHIEMPHTNVKLSVVCRNVNCQYFILATGLPLSHKDVSDRAIPTALLKPHVETWLWLLRNHLRESQGEEFVNSQLKAGVTCNIGHSYRRSKMWFLVWSNPVTKSKKQKKKTQKTKTENRIYWSNFCVLYMIMLKLRCLDLYQGFKQLCVCSEGTTALCANNCSSGSADNPLQLPCSQSLTWFLAQPGNTFH